MGEVSRSPHMPHRVARVGGTPTPRLNSKDERVNDMAKEADNTVIEKVVKLPLVVKLTGTKSAIANDGEALTDMLTEKLPMVVRLGRGQKTTISIAVKEAKEL